MSRLRLRHDNPQILRFVNIMRLPPVKRHLSDIRESRWAGFTRDISVECLTRGEPVADESGGEDVGGPDRTEELGQPVSHVDIGGEVVGYVACTC